jgi:hydrogenase maturation protease
MENIQVIPSQRVFPLGSKRRKNRILVIGLGNLLLRDDGVGVHAIRRLREAPHPRILLAEVGTAVLDSLHLLEWADKILAIDAMAAGGKPGTVYSFGVPDVADRGLPTSLHELGLLSALRFLPRQKGPAIQILGVEPESIEYGLELTPAVHQALPLVLRRAKEVVAGWRS